jgi:hypothetical protein
MSAKREQKYQWMVRNWSTLCVDCGQPHLSPQGQSPRCRPCHNAHATVWTAEAVLDAFRRWYAETGQTPRMTDWNRRPGYPAAGTVKKHFGKWTTAIAQAGLPQRQKTQGKARRTGRNRQMVSAGQHDVRGITFTTDAT